VFCGIYNAIALLFAQLFSQLVVAEVSHPQLPVVLFVFFRSSFSGPKKRECDVPITHANPICSSLGVPVSEDRRPDPAELGYLWLYGSTAPFLFRSLARTCPDIGADPGGGPMANRYKYQPSEENQ